MTTVLIIFGIIFIIWFGLVSLFNIVVYIAMRYSSENKYCWLTRDTSVMGTEFNEWYLIPSINFHFGFLDKTWPTIIIVWLKWNLTICYHLKTEEEEELYCKLRHELRTKNNES